MSRYYFSSQYIMSLFRTIIKWFLQSILMTIYIYKWIIFTIQSVYFILWIFHSTGTEASHSEIIWGERLLLCESCPGRSKKNVEWCVLFPEILKIWDERGWNRADIYIYIYIYIYIHIYIYIYIIYIYTYLYIYTHDDDDDDIWDYRWWG